MSSDRIETKHTDCKDSLKARRFYKDQLPEVIQAVAESCLTHPEIVHLDMEAIPSKESVISIIDDLIDIMYPGFFGNQRINRNQLRYHVGDELSRVFDALAEEIKKAMMHECVAQDKECINCADAAQRETMCFLRKIPNVREMLAGDVRATYDHDPAAKSTHEIVFCYPGIKAITIYRLAHELYLQNVPLIPRIMTEYAHAETGVDIHPGANIGKNFFIDHGTGIVIGETTQIGDDVCIYHGVTLGALKFDRDADDQLIRGVKRHPTVGDKVVIYSGSTLLGSDTIVGERSVVGGNSWLIESIPAGTKVIYECPQLKFKKCSECALADKCDRPE